MRKGGKVTRVAALVLIFIALSFTVASWVAYETYRYDRPFRAGSLPYTIDLDELKYPAAYWAK